MKTSRKYCTCHTKQLSTRSRTRLNVTKCHACHAKRSNDTSETSKNDHLCWTSHRHGHMVLARTVALANATSSEHTLNPQTPRVKRKPLLRIREKWSTWGKLRGDRRKKNSHFTLHAWHSTLTLDTALWTSRSRSFPFFFVPPQWAVKSEHGRHSYSCHARGKARVLLLMSNTNSSHPGWLWRTTRTSASFLWWCWCRKRPPERTLRVEERRCPTFSPLGPVSLCCFTFPFDYGYVTVSLLVFRVASDMWSFMPVRLTLGDLGAPGWGEPWFPLRVVLLLSHVFMYGDVFVLFCVLFGSLAPCNDSMMHKTSLFHWAGLVHNADFAFRVFFVLLFGVLFLCCLCFAFVWFCFFNYGIVTALQDCVAGPQPALWLGSPMHREGCWTRPNCCN